jgi:hypothetical protein
MKTRAILAAIALLTAAPAFASDRGRTRDQPDRQTHAERTPATASNGGSALEPAATHPHDRSAAAEGKAKNSSGATCGCTTKGHAHS